MHSKSALPSRKSRNSGLWFSRQRLRRPSANASREQLAGLLDAEEVVLVGRLLVGVGRRDHHLVDLELVVEEVEHLRARSAGESWVKNVVFVVTRKPRALAARIACDRLVEDALALDRGVVALAQAVDVHGPGEVRAGLEEVELALHQQRVRAQVDELACRLMSSSAIRWISGWMSGSPPAIETIGAPHSSIAPTACSTGIRRRSSCSGCWILPQPEQARLHWNSGSSSTISGNFSRRGEALAGEVGADADALAHWDWHRLIDPSRRECGDA